MLICGGAWGKLPACPSPSQKNSLTLTNSLPSRPLPSPLLPLRLCVRLLTPGELPGHCKKHHAKAQSSPSSPRLESYCCTHICIMLHHAGMETGFGVFRKSDCQVRRFILICGCSPRRGRGFAARLAPHTLRLATFFGTDCNDKRRRSLGFFHGGDFWGWRLLWCQVDISGKKHHFGVVHQISIHLIHVKCLLDHASLLSIQDRQHAPPRIQIQLPDQLAQFG